MKFARIVISYVVKYLMGFLLVFICSVMVFFVAKENIENYIIKQAQMQTMEGIRIIDETIKKLDLTSQMLYQNHGFSQLIYQSENFNKNDILLLRDNNNLMQQIGLVAEYTPYMFTLFQKNDLYLSSTQCSLSFTKYYDRLLSLCFSQEPVSDASALKSILFEIKNSGQYFTPVTSIRYSNSTGDQYLENALMYLTDGTNEPSRSLHIFCFILSNDYLTESILMPELASDSFLYIQDIASGTDLLTYGDVPDIIKQNSAAADQDRIQGYIINNTVQSRLGWRIVTGIPVSFINKQIEPVQQLLMAYLGLGFLAVILLTLYFSLVRYYGFRKVLFSFPTEELKLIDQKGFNDYKLITENVTQLDESRKTHLLELDALKSQNQAIFLENLITNGIRTPQEQQAFGEYFEREPEFYSVVMVRFLQTDLTILESAAIDMVSFLEKERIKLLGNVHSGISDELFLIELSPSQQVNEPNLLKTFEEMIQMISEKYSVVLHVGISTVGTGLSNINKCYEQTKQIVQAQYLFENENAIKAYDITTNALTENPVTIEYLNRLYTMLICGQSDEVKKELSQIEGRYLRMPYLYQAHKEQVFYSLRNVFYTAVLHLNCKDWQSHVPTYVPAMQCQEMTAAFHKSADWICEYIRRSKKSKNTDLKDSIMDILTEQYPEPGLSAFTVSKQVGISEKYLFQFWKEQTGETFATTLLRIRIQKAKEYLEQTDYSNEQIASLIGFATANTFYRNFQKLAGVTPKTYKDNYLSKNNTGMTL